MPSHELDSPADELGLKGKFKTKDVKPTSMRLDEKPTSESTSGIKRNPVD